MDFNNVSLCVLMYAFYNIYAATVSMKCEIKLCDLRASSIYSIIKYQA